jgi:uncharacterized protein (TIGR03000 family)
MYSVVLMMAMTGGGDAPAGLFSHHSCHGCTGAPVAACDCAPPVYTSCSGCEGGHHKLFGGGLFHKHHHSCSGCTGAPVYVGCTGVSPYAGCVGSPPVIVPLPVEKPKETIPAPKPKEEKKSGEISAPATLIVNVPTNAVLTIDGNVTSSTSTRRVFESPVLQAGREFRYTLQATFTVEGRQVVLSKSVIVTAGAEATVDFNNVAVASR